MDTEEIHMVYLLLGSNLGNRRLHLLHGLDEIRSRAGKVLQQSSIYETEPWGVTDQPDYLNAACKIETTLSPENLFSVLKKIEIGEGRISQKKYASRTLDIDIVFYDDLILQSEGLIIPHPKIHLRKFVLAPLDEIAPDFIHPAFKKSMRQLLDECDDSLEVRNFA